MHDTLVIQSHQSPLPYSWIARCLASVRDWCAINHYEYRFIGDELFDCVPAQLLEKTHHQKMIAADIARLLTLQLALQSDCERAVWMDADFLVFHPSKFVLPDLPYALGRETWVQQDKRGELKVYKKLHNAFLMFRKGNSFLDFYAETAQRLLTLNEGTMSPQFIGPKLLTALHNVAALPVMETAGMFSPMVIKDIIHGGGVALDRFVEHSPQAPAAANLCISSCINNKLSSKDMDLVIDSLLARNHVSVLTVNHMNS